MDISWHIIELATITTLLPYNLQEHLVLFLPFHIADCILFLNRSTIRAYFLFIIPSQMTVRLTSIPIHTISAVE